MVDWKLAEPEPTRTPSNMETYRSGYISGVKDGAIAMRDECAQYLEFTIGNCKASGKELSQWIRAIPVIEAFPGMNNE